MAKTKISEWSSTPGNNTDIDGINIAEGCAPSGINDAIREMMSQVKDLYSGTTGDAIGVAGGGTGATTASAARTNLGVAIGTDVQAYNPNLSAYASTGIGFRNRIINGDMRIDQRNAGASVTPAAPALTYTVDRWGFFNSTGTNRFSAQRNAGSVTPPAGFTNYLGFTVTSAYTPSGADEQFLSQQIEGFNVADLGWGTSNAQAVTATFWVRSSITGTHSGAVRNPNGYSRSYPFTFTVSAANTWEQKTITIPGDTGGTWNTNNAAGIQFGFNLGSGPSSLGTASVWSATNAFTGATGSVQVSATNGATFYITGVQLEAGTVATPFERRDYGRELMMCQRYCQMIYFGEAFGVFWSYSNSMHTQPLKVIMRSSPSLTFPTVLTEAIDQIGSGVRTPTALIPLRTSGSTAAFYAEGMTGGVVGAPAQWIGGPITLSAEL